MLAQRARQRPVITALRSLTEMSDTGGESGLYGGRYYWPEDVGTDSSLDSWVQKFVHQGYETTGNRDLEPGFEKIAIYVDTQDNRPSHVALSDGRTWKSKLGKLQDIEHASLDILEGDQEYEYGIVEHILRRSVSR